MKRFLFLFILGWVVISCGSDPIILFVDIHDNTYQTSVQRDSAHHSYFQQKYFANDSVLVQRKANLMNNGMSEKKAEEILESYGISQNKRDRDAEIRQQEDALKELTDRIFKEYKNSGDFPELEKDGVWDEFIERLNSMNQNDENIIYL